jgi:hypothetical protein
MSIKNTTPQPDRTLELKTYPSFKPATVVVQKIQDSSFELLLSDGSVLFVETQDQGTLVRFEPAVSEDEEPLISFTANHDGDAAVFVRTRLMKNLTHG